MTAQKSVNKEKAIEEKVLNYELANNTTYCAAIHDEEMLAILIGRLRGYQSGPEACKEYATALSKLELASDILKVRAGKNKK